MDGHPEVSKPTYEQAAAARRRQLDQKAHPLTTKTATVGPPVTPTLDNPAGVGQYQEVIQRGAEVRTVVPPQPIVVQPGTAAEVSGKKKWWQFWK